MNLNNEIGVIVYKTADLAFVLEIDDKSNKLVMLTYNKSFSKIKNIFNINKINTLISFDKNIDADYYYNLNNNIILKDFYIKSDLYILKLYNYNFCIVNSENIDIDGCTFIYFNSINNNIRFSDDNKVVFYSNLVDSDFKEMIYTKWLDIYELNHLNYTVLKVKKDDYNIINIPV